MDMWWISSTFHSRATTGRHSTWRTLPSVSASLPWCWICSGESGAPLPPPEVRMYPVLWDLHLGKLGQFTLGTYGLFYAVAFLVAVRVSMAYAKREGIDPTRMIDLGIWTLLSGIVGAKLLLVLVELPYYWRHKMEILYNWRSAGVFYGGFVLACAVGLWYVHRTRLPLARTADAVAPGVALAQAIGRIGCFCAGCCYGKPTNIRWGVTFVDPRAHDLTGVPLGVTLHPTQIYHGLADLALFCMLVTLYPRK